MDMHRISLTREKETLLITLFAKAGESQMSGSVLRDTFAAQAVRHIDYDFSKLKVTRDMMVGLGIRARMLDRWTLGFVAANPGASVLHLGCGLDTRVFRTDPPPSVSWFDVDFPEVVELRKQLYPEREGYRLIGSSVVDTKWLDEVPSDRPAIVIAEGLLAYLREEEVQHLFQAVTAHLPSGEADFDAFSGLGVKLLRHQSSVKATGASLHWGIDDPHELEILVPKLKFLDEVPSYDSTELAQFSLPSRITTRVMLAFPKLRRIGRFLRYRF